MIKKFTLLTFAFILFGGYAISQVLVKDIRPGSYGSGASRFTSVNSILFFAADTSITGNNPQLWKSDGTSLGTSLVSEKILSVSGASLGMVSMGGYLYYAAYDINLGLELHKTDGTISGTTLIKDIMANNSPGFKHSTPQNLFVFDGAVYFSADDGINGRELWKSDGTNAGTVMVKDIRPGQYGSIDSPYFTNFAVLNNMLYFAAWDGSSGGVHELWKTDGTGAGTVIVQTSNPGNIGRYPRNLFEFNGNLFFYASDQNGIVGRELYKSNGTSAGTILLKDINTGNYQSSDPSEFVIANNILFFTASVNANGKELWKTDGTEAGTVMVKDILPGTSSGLYDNKSYLTSLNNKVYFRAYDTMYGLWKSDGTSNGTVMVKAIEVGSSSSSGESLCELNGSIYFKAGAVGNGTIGAELWKSDGTLAGTVLVKDIYPGPSSSSPGNLINHQNILFFSANDGINGGELWKYVGTIAGINETYKSSYVTIYPNPSNGIFQLNFDDLQSMKGVLEIYNLLGENVYTESNIQQHMQIDLSALSKGIYSVSVKINNGTNTYIQKIAIQ